MRRIETVELNSDLSLKFDGKTVDLQDSGDTNIASLSKKEVKDLIVLLTEWEAKMKDEPFLSGRSNV